MFQEQNRRAQRFVLQMMRLFAGSASPPSAQLSEAMVMAQEGAMGSGLAVIASDLATINLMGTTDSERYRGQLEGKHQEWLNKSQPKDGGSFNTGDPLKNDSWQKKLFDIAAKIVGQWDIGDPFDLE